MTVNAAIWRWTEAYDTSSKRYRLHTKMGDVYDAIIEGATHPAQAEFDQRAFSADLRRELGPEARGGGDWVVEYYDKAVVISLPNAIAMTRLPQIERVARRHSLNVSAVV